MILVDTSVWVDFFRGAAGCRALAGYLEEGEVLTHPWVVGELAVGDLGRRRRAILADLRSLPAVTMVPDEEVLALVDARRLYARGVGWIDVHLLSSARVDGAPLWTRDRRLARLAAELDVAFELAP